MPSPHQPDDAPRPKRPLPPELAFLTDLTKIKDMDADELAIHGRRQNELIRERAALIREYGLDPDYLIACTEPMLLDLERRCQECDEVNAALFHAVADRADAERELFRHLSSVVEQAYAEKPFDPEVQEWKEAIDEWRQEMPKE